MALFLALTAVYLSPQIIRVMAANDDYSVSGGNPFSLSSVGPFPTALPTITLTDAGGDDFTSDPETIRIDINTMAYPNVIWDVIPFAMVGGSCGYDTVDAVIPNSDTQIDVVISGGGFASCADGQTIAIDGLGVLSIFAAPAPGASPLIAVDNNSTSAGSSLFTSDDVNLEVLAGSLTGLMWSLIRFW